MKWSVGLAIVLCFVAAQNVMAGIASIEGPVDVKGTLVTGRPCDGAGIIILTDTGEQTIFGIGPVS
jgi:hypothetical protein